ncbi:MAG: hypothetical protein K9M55_05925 [Candidatus Marinimicrobia bacterium]|nr:hypothetical protein [Candidatus Neomarinimicrobiota bacterium]MCF7922222.1 hypothetical protein [Candidatus Neomarinimicrobiota bacterium]
MCQFLKHSPSKKLTRILLILGFLVFIPVYTYMLTFFKKLGIDSTEYSNMLLSFDVGIFRAFIAELVRGDHLSQFLWVFQLNIISITGFMTAFFALGLIIDRHIAAESWLFRFTFISPLLAVLVAALDIIASLVFLFAGGDLVNITQYQVNIISLFYYVRVLVLYVVILWFIIAGIAVLLNRRRKK